MGEVKALALRVGPWLLLALVAALWIGSGQRAERRVGEARALLDSAGVRVARAERRADSLARVYRADTVRLWRLTERWDTVPVTVERWKRDTLEVVRYVALADSTIQACTAALQTCEARVAAEQAVTEGVRDSVRALLILERRPWTAAGLTWDAQTARVGAYVDRDWSRFRAGMSLTPDAAGLRLELRAGVRW